jgi:ferredoxin-type protein NapH
MVCPAEEAAIVIEARKTCRGSMSKHTESLLVMLGREPQSRSTSAQRQQIHELKRVEKVDWVAQKEHARAHRAQGQKWRNRRWAFLLFINLLFTLSFWLDIQILEGALTASRLLGFHLIDINSALQVMLAHKHIIINLIIGTGTVVVLWFLFGGRTFCSWVVLIISSPSSPKNCIVWREKLVTDHTIHRCQNLWLSWSWPGSPAIPCSKPSRRPDPVAGADLRGSWRG